MRTPSFNLLGAATQWSARSAVYGPRITHFVVYHPGAPEKTSARRIFGRGPLGAVTLNTMNHSEYGSLKEGNTVMFERPFSGPVEFIWCYLTTKELLATWIGDGGLECSIGGNVSLHTPGNSICGVVTAVKPYRSLSFRWSPSPNGDGSDLAAAGDSLVTFRLEQRGLDSILIVTHAPVSREHLPKAFALWHAFLDRLAASVLRLSPEPFLRRYFRVVPEYERRFGMVAMPAIRPTRRMTYRPAQALLHA